jgi:ankyrin repeat protein
MLKRVLSRCVGLFIFLTCAVIALEFAGCNKTSGMAPSTSSNATLYEAAASGSSRESAQALIDRGQAVNEPNPANGWTPLHAAAGNGHPKMVQCLLENDAEVNARSNNGSTPLHFAMASRHSKVVSILLMYGADKSIRNDLGIAAGDMP